MQRLSMLFVLGVLVGGTGHAQSMDHAAMPGMNMDASGLAALHGRAFDRAFLSMMTVHHQGAIDMSEAVLGHVRDPQVKRWAQDIVKAQRAEITEMTDWLGQLGGVDRAAQAGMARDMNTMVAVVRRRPTDREFISSMTPHHASAIGMATLALQRSSDPRVLGLARQIIQAQAAELYGFRLWLVKHPG